ncbi:MAG: hypothetical protein BWK79_16355 [Beggiatoa sp. IS2]|nr:MAG: hypothetical protein BWK79_16355 [Beggiatoa sp. IS2]
MLLALTTSVGETFNAIVMGPKIATKGVLIVHDWWGVLDYNLEWAKRFVNLGYRAMVIDLYDGHRPVDVKEAGEYMRNIDQELANRKLQTALAALKGPHRKVGVLGWSFGGLQAQQVILHSPQLADALVFFYCRVLLDRSKIAGLRCPVLAIFAETEPTWPDKQAALEHVMTESGKILECHSYDAGHGFANPDSLRYDKEVTEKSWQITITFLNKYLA